MGFIDASAFILLPQMLVENGMLYNLACGNSDRNNFLNKGFIITLFFEGLQVFLSMLKAYTLNHLTCGPK